MMLFRVFAHFITFFYNLASDFQMAGETFPAFDKPYPFAYSHMRFLPNPRLLLAASLIAFSGCGGGESSSADSASASDEMAATTPMGNATVSGTISFAGTAPAMAPIRLDRECQDLHDGQVTDEAVVVNDNGTLKNVFVRVTEGLPADYNYAAPTEPMVFDQSGCMYHPHVFGMQVGQTFKILNSDPLLHNIHGLAEENRPFNFGMPNKGDEREREFQVPEVMMHIKCDVHPWMSAYGGIVDHPYFSVSGEDGTFSLANVPAGTYTIEAWHEEYGSSTQTVTVTDGGSATVNFTFGPDA